MWDSLTGFCEYCNERPVFICDMEFFDLLMYCQLIKKDFVPSG